MEMLGVNAPVSPFQVQNEQRENVGLKLHSRNRIYWMLKFCSMVCNLATYAVVTGYIECQLQIEIGLNFV